MGVLVKIVVFVIFCLVITDASVAGETVHRISNEIGTMMEDVKLPLENAERIIRIEETVRELRNIVVDMQAAAAETRADQNTLKVELLRLIEQKLQGIDANPVLGTLKYPRNCVDVKENGHTTSGMYTVYTTEEGDVSQNQVLKPVTVFCDMDTEGGGWLVILNRIGDANYFDHTKNFWAYENGFGATSGSHWLGNKFIAGITGQMQYSLKIVLEDFEGETRHADYRYFRVGPKDSDYRLFIGGYYNGTVIDGMYTHDGMRFSTPDHDRDEHTSHCAETYNTGWWFRGCHRVMLTGRYYPPDKKPRYADGINWAPWHGYEYSLKKAKMMIKPADHIS